MVKNTPRTNPIGWMLFILFLIFIIFCAFNTTGHHVHTPMLTGIIGGMI